MAARRSSTLLSGISRPMSEDRQRSAAFLSSTLRFFSGRVRGVQMFIARPSIISIAIHPTRFWQLATPSAISKTKEFERYGDVRRSRTEREVRKLADITDTVVATDRCTPVFFLVRAIALLGLYPRMATPLVDVLVGGRYGSEGKGNIVGHIAPVVHFAGACRRPQDTSHEFYAVTSTRSLLPSTFRNLTGTKRTTAPWRRCGDQPNEAPSGNYDSPCRGGTP